MLSTLLLSFLWELWFAIIYSRCFGSYLSPRILYDVKMKLWSHCCIFIFLLLYTRKYAILPPNYSLFCLFFPCKRNSYKIWRYNPTPLYIFSFHSAIFLHMLFYLFFISYIFFSPWTVPFNVSKKRKVCSTRCSASLSTPYLSPKLCRGPVQTNAHRMASPTSLHFTHLSWHHTVGKWCAT